MKQKNKTTLHPFVISLLILFGAIILFFTVIGGISLYFFRGDDTKQQQSKFQTIAGELSMLKQKILKDNIFSNVNGPIDKCEYAQESFGIYRCELKISADTQSKPQEIMAHLLNVLKNDANFAITSQTDTGETYKRIDRIASKYVDTLCEVNVLPYNDSQQVSIVCRFSSREQLHIK